MNFPRLVFALVVLICGSAFAALPNIVLILADDCTAPDLEVYGGQARTPHLKRLVEEGMTFTRCFHAAPPPNSRADHAGAVARLRPIHNLVIGHWSLVIGHWSLVIRIARNRSPLEI